MNGRTMTMTEPRTPMSQGRIGLLALIVAGMVLFAAVPSALDLGAEGTDRLYLTGWILTPLWASLAALRTASECEGSSRTAWRHFALGCLLWMAGTLVWASYGWFGWVLPIPSLADVVYILSAFFFMSGMFHYSLTGLGKSRILLTNFALATASVLSIGVAVYVPFLADSKFDWLGTLVAFSYPALWLCTLAFGLICYGLYVPVRRKLPFLLILASVAAHATADFFYGFDILNESYAAGNFYDTYWIASFALLAWAAAAHCPVQCTPIRLAGSERPAAWAESLIPAVSTAAILMTIVAAIWHHLGLSALLLVPVIIAFAGLLAFREHTLFTNERRLRSEAEESARQLAESEARLSGVLENTTDGVMVLDQQWRIDFANRNAVAMMFRNRPYLGLEIWTVLRSREGNEFYRNYSIAMEQQKPVEFEAHFAPLDMWLEVHAYPTAHDITIFFRDVTERRRLRERLVHLSRHDPLTDLANRAQFTERLAAGLQGGRRNRDLVLVLIDLDGFKAVNDSLGHMAGDSLLTQFAGRLIGLARQGDTVARFGGDEFAIIQPGPIAPQGGKGVREGGGVEVARRICEAMRQPFNVHDTEVTLGASIGIAVAPEHGTRPEELIFNADLALYRAKATTGDGVKFCIFEPGLDDHLQTRRQPRLHLLRA